MARIRFKQSTHPIIKQRFVKKRTFIISLIFNALQASIIGYCVYQQFLN